MPEPSRLRRLDSLLDMLLYRMTRIHAEAGGLVIRVCEGRFGITRQEWRVMSHIALTDGIHPTDLAQRCGLDKARTSRNLHSLVQKQLVLRQPQPSDRRHVVVRLTPEGRRVHDELLPLARRINQEVLAALSPEEVDWLDGVLDRLQARAEQVAADHGDELPKTQRRLGQAGR